MQIGENIEKLFMLKKKLKKDINPQTHISMPFYLKMN